MSSRDEIKIAKAPAPMIAERIARRRQTGSQARWEPLRKPGPDDVATIEQRFGFGNSDKVYDLVNRLREIGTRDHLSDWSVAKAYKLRAEVSEIVKEIKSLSHKTLEMLQRLQRKLQYFERFGYHPQLMRYTFVEPMNDPSDIHLPDHLNRFSELVRPKEYWEEVAQKLCRVAEVELKPTGTPSNDSLAMAARACREFWKGHGRPGAGAFKTHVELGDDVAIVDEPFERFCVDCLGAAGIDFTITGLRTALAK